MIVISHDDTRVVLSIDGLVIQSEQCLDRYRLPGRWSDSQSRGVVEIWALPDGRVVRLSQGAQPGAEWVAHAWV